MQLLIPFKYRNPKSRLSSILDQDQRKELALRMLRDVLDIALESKLFGSITVISTDPLELGIPGVELKLCPGSLDQCLNSFLEGAQLPVLILMADLPLIWSKDLVELLARPESVVLVPGRRGGTNAILIRDPRFRVSYHGISFLKHLELAKHLGLDWAVHESLRIWADMDLPEDLIDLLIHAPSTRSAEFIRRLEPQLRDLAASLMGDRKSGWDQ